MELKATNTYDEGETSNGEVGNGKKRGRRGGRGKRGGRGRRGRRGRRVIKGMQRRIGGKRRRGMKGRQGRDRNKERMMWIHSFIMRRSLTLDRVAPNSFFCPYVLMSNLLTDLRRQINVSKVPIQSWKQSSNED